VPVTREDQCNLPAPAALQPPPQRVFYVSALFSIGTATMVSLVVVYAISGRECAGVSRGDFT